MSRYKKEPGDWICKCCNKGNFKRRRDCYGCGMRRGSKKSGNSMISQSIDWNCPNCDDHQFARNTHCRKCGTSKDGSSIKIKDGDWLCPKCTKHQFAKNVFCRDCGHPKDPETKKDKDDFDLDGEECVICMDNPKNATLIHGDCGHTVCCMDCAKTLEICPICRRKIDNVIRNFQ